MEAWEQLVRTALLGAERESFAPSHLDGAVGHLLDQVPSAEPEKHLLSAAAVLSTYRQAGWSAARIENAAPDVCPPDAQTACSRRAGDRLGQILSGEQRAVLPEWLATVRQASLRVPHRYLAALLDLGVSERALREPISQVIGVRGQWLIQRNSQWQYAAQEGDGLWETGSPDARVRLLRSKRQADPAAGRQMLIAVWDQEPPELKAKFLEALEVGLSMDDEPFLEDALDQKRKEVRKTAAELLARLPQSRLSHRMLQRIRPLIQVHTRQRLLGWGKNSIQIDVALPTECDKMMRRDGIEPKPPSYKGEKAWWLEQMLGAVPPSIFSNESGIGPSDLVAAAVRHEFADTLLAGWATGCQRHADSRWAQALIVTLIDEEPEINKPPAAHMPWSGFARLWIQGLAPQIPAESQEQIALAAVAKKGLSGFTIDFLDGCDHVWSAELTRAIIGAVRNAIRRELGPRSGHLPAVLRDRFALRMDPSLVQEISQDWPTDTETWKRCSGHVETMLATLQFRHDMLKEIEQ